MKVTVCGAGPAGLYLGILLKKADPRHEVRLVERNQPDATFGWGVVFSEETLGALRDADYPSYTAITDTFARWDAVDISYRGRLMRCRGHGFSAIARKRLLAILRARAEELDVRIHYGEQAEPRELAVGADLLVGADGVHSAVRSACTEFATTIKPQGCKYVWYGTEQIFDAFRFVFAETEYGLFQVHAYPFDERTSTFIVECPEPVWRAAGLDTMDEDESMAFCERLFADALGGRPLLSNRSTWLDFPLVRNRSWHGRLNGTPVVLVGDAAHTAHFTIGSGTKLAMEDSIALSNAFERHQDVAPALVHYERERGPVVERFQQAAGDSADYFARVRHHTHLDPPQFAFNLLTRSGRISHAGLTLRDPEFVRGVDSWFGGGSRLSPPPAFTPLRIGGLELPNRIVRRAGRADGAGLLLSELFAVTPEGRVTPRTPVLEGNLPPEAADALRSAKDDGVAIAAFIGHAGRRGATRTPQLGVDVPLPARESWPLVAASALPYGPLGQVPREADEVALEEIRTAFAHAAELVATAGFDLLELDCAHGRLLAGFLSPLSNRREDAYGGPLAHRLRYPLEVLDSVRSAWPSERPLAVRLTCTDWARGGLTTDDAVVVARAMDEHGADLVHVVAGQTVAESKPEYRAGFLTAISDRVRNEAGIATLVGGHLSTIDSINTVLAAGRADACIADLPDDAKENR